MSRYHFTGIAGVGMSALAEAALQQGHEVTGSDRLLDSGQETQVLSALRLLGASLFPQDGSGISGETDAVVVSTAIEEGNPDLSAAQEHGATVLHRSEMLGILARGHGRRFAVSGTCGKSTVTGLAGWLLAQAGMDPTVINGAPLADWMGEDAVGSARLGNGEICVFEADESDRSLLNYGYEVAIVTNSSADHFSQEDADALFDEFASRAESVLDAREAEFLADVEIGDRTFTYNGVSFSVPMPGEHNVLNAIVAVRICEAAGCDLGQVAGALKGFRGVSRRLELIGKSSGVAVYDDYAHNTEKIRAVLATLSEQHKKVVAIWRPHGYGPLRNMMGDLVDMFSEALRDDDELILLPVYDAGGSADRSVNSGDLAGRLTNALSVDLAEEACARAVESGADAVVTLGARDPGLPELAHRILEEL